MVKHKVIKMQWKTYLKLRKAFPKEKNETFDGWLERISQRLWWADIELKDIQHSDVMVEDDN